MCGGWDKRNVIPEDSSSYDIFVILSERIAITLNSLLGEPEKSTDIFTTKQSKRFYSSCINRTSIESQVVERLRAAAQAVNGLPIVTANYDVDQFSLEEFYSFTPIYSTIFSIQPFHFAVQVDLNNSDVLILNV